MNHKNFAQSTLAAAITNTTAPSITVVSSATFPAVPFIISIDTEAMLVTVVSGTTWTVTRGYEGSAAATHLNGAIIYHDISAEETDSITALSSAISIGDTGQVGIGTGEFTNDLFYLWDLVPTVTTKAVIKGLKSGSGDLKSLVLLLLDSNERPVVSFNVSGRLDLVDWSGQGAVAVLYNQGAAVNDELAGHYAFGARNSAGDMNTVAHIAAYVPDITETDMSSKMIFSVMSHEDTSAGYSQPNMAMILDKNGLWIDGSLTATKFQLSALNTAPANAGDTGTAGEIRFASGYIYLCVATNTWQRSALATW